MTDERLIQCGRYLTALIRAGLTGVSAQTKPENISWDELYQMASIHGVEYLAWQGARLARDEAFTPEQKAQWERRAWQCALQSMVQTEELRALMAQLHSEGIPACPMKGPWLKPLYPQPEQRQMVDLDILICASDRRCVRELMEARGYFCRFFEEKYDDAYRKEPYLYVEMHTAPVDEKNPHRVWAERHLADGDGGWRWQQTPPSPEEQYLYLLMHLEKHWTSIGCGMRPLLDLRVFRAAHSGSWSESTLSALCRETGLTAFRREMERLSDRLFSPEAQRVPDAPWDDAEYLVYLSGAYGSTRSRVESALLLGRGGASFGRTANYLLSRLFPPLAEAEKTYKVLKRAPWLYPSVWLYRLIRLPFAPDSAARRELRVMRELLKQKEETK